MIKSQRLIISKGEKFRKFPDLILPKILEVEKRKRKQRKGRTWLNVTSDNARFRPLTPRIVDKNVQGDRSILNPRQAPIDSGPMDAGEFRQITEKGGTHSQR